MKPKKLRRKILIHHLFRSFVIDCQISKAWDFLATPRNLNRITPENMAFEIVSFIPEKMVNGLLIELGLTQN